MKGSDVVSRLRVILNDADEVGWTTAELILWINDGCRFIALLRPDSVVVNASMTLVAGSKQSIGALTPPGLRLLDVVRAVATGRAVRLVDREKLDTVLPSWHGATSGVPTNYTFDNRDPKTFYVYPPATVGTQIEVVYSRVPLEVTTGNLASQDLSIDDVFMDPLLNYVLHRAYCKDADHAKNAALAAGYRQLAELLLAGKSKADAVYSPDLNTPHAAVTAGAMAGGV